MKFIINDLRVGQRVYAEVVEMIRSGYLIVSIGGDLIRVKDQTKSHLNPGQKIALRVSGVSPLELKLEDRHLGYQVQI